MSVRPAHIVLAARQDAPESVPTIHGRLTILTALFALGFVLLAARTLSLFLSAGAAP